MKTVRSALIFACLAGFGFGIANGCGTEPLSSPRKKISAAGSSAGSDGAAGDEVGAAGTPVSTGGTNSSGVDTTGAGGANSGPLGAGGTTAGGANGGASGSEIVGVGGGAGAAAGGGSAGAGGSGGAGGSAGAGGSGGAGGAAGTGGSAGAGGSPPVGCPNAAVVDAAGSATKCPAMNTWTATAMPTPPSMYMGIPDNKLQPQYAIDGNTGTRYSTGAKAAGGEWFRVDLGVSTQITGIVVDDSNNLNDVASGYKVEVSADGNTWTLAASCNAVSSPVETINFAAKTGRYVRITQTTVGPHWWSIGELSVLCK